MFKKLIVVAMCLQPFYVCAYDSLEDMKKDNEQRMNRIRDEIKQDRNFMELRRANDEQEKANRYIIQSQPKLFGR